MRTSLIQVLTVLIFALAGLLASPACANAQTDDDFETAPPPLKYVSKQDKALLDSEANPKDRTKTALSLMDARLDDAEKLNAAENFNAMFSELGHFAGLLDNSLNFLSRQPDDKKNLDNYKRLEIGIRRFMGRLEVVRRELPLRYEKYVRDLIKYLRVSRSRALEPQFSDTVLPQG